MALQGSLFRPVRSSYERTTSSPELGCEAEANGCDSNVIARKLSWLAPGDLNRNCNSTLLGHYRITGPSK